MTEPKITPLARRLAEENGIDWRELKGTGPDGTIVERDILAYLAKVMAGEVDLPPAPAEESSPPTEVPDLSAAQAALAKEGLDLDDLVPPSPQEPTPPEETAWELELDLDDLEFAPEEEALTGPEASPTPDRSPPTAETPGDEPPSTAPEREAGEALTWPDPSPVPDLSALVLDTSEAHARSQPDPSQTPDVDPSTSTAPATAEAEEPLEEPEAYALNPEGTDEAAPDTSRLTWEDVPHPSSGAEPRTAEPQLEVTPVPPEGVDREPAASEAEAAPDLEDAVAPVPVPTAARTVAPGEGIALKPVHRRVVTLEAAMQAARDLAEAWNTRVPLLLFVYRAAARALEELDVSLSPVMGSYEDGILQAYTVPAATGLKDTLTALQQAREPGEGLVVLSLEGAAVDEVVFPGTPLLTLGRAGLPEGLGLLSLSESPVEEAERLLERVAFYLERPILLA